MHMNLNGQERNNGYTMLIDGSTVGGPTSQLLSKVKDSSRLDMSVAETSVEYYNTLLRMSKMRNFKGTFPKPDQLSSILYDCGRSTGGSIVIPTVNFYVLMQTLYRLKNRVSKDNKMSDEDASPPQGKKRTHNDMEKKTKSRQDCVPEQMCKFRSKASRIATMIFCMHEYI